jgi:hypothetical protein
MRTVVKVDTLFAIMVLFPNSISLIKLKENGFATVEVDCRKSSGTKRSTGDLGNIT